MLIDGRILEANNHSFLGVVFKNQFRIITEVDLLNASSKAQLTNNSRRIGQERIDSQVHVLAHVTVEQDDIAHDRLFEVTQF